MWGKIALLTVRDESLILFYSMGVSNPLSNSVRSHYSRTFGHFNQEFVIHGHTFIGLDAPGLVDEDYQRAAKGVGYDEWNSPQEGPVSFVKNVATTGAEPKRKASSTIADNALLFLCIMQLGNLLFY